MFISLDYYLQNNRRKGTKTLATIDVDAID